MIAIALLATTVIGTPAIAASNHQQPQTQHQQPQTQQMQPKNNAQNQQSAADSTQNLAAAQKIKQDLQQAGFSDVKVVAESFVVQGKSSDGDPVVMTIGPHGMSVFEAMNPNASGSGTVGQSRSPSGSSGTPSNPSAMPNSGMQK
jgi:hypothetical protein